MWSWDLRRFSEPAVNPLHASNQSPCVDPCRFVFKAELAEEREKVEVKPGVSRRCRDKSEVNAGRF